MATGCLHRSLTIRTEPPGALVYLNDRLIGESPVAFDFEWYGWHRVMIRKSGFERIEDRKLLRAPAHLWIPFDLAMELAPFPVNDQRTWSYALTPLQSLPEPQPPLTEAGTTAQSGGRRGNPVAEGEGTTESTEEPSDAAR
ncbi:MAG: PEGA domain-containing protein [Candidatus Omnitrophica bacterium]|nr:PEGA domain-containing protein [Candidatus Omnitrophota bacterium]